MKALSLSARKAAALPQQDCHNMLRSGDSCGSWADRSDSDLHGFVNLAQAVCPEVLKMFSQCIPAVNPMENLSDTVPRDRPRNPGGPGSLNTQGRDAAGFHHSPQRAVNIAKNAKTLQPRGNVATLKVNTRATSGLRSQPGVTGRREG